MKLWESFLMTLAMMIVCGVGCAMLVLPVLYLPSWLGGIIDGLLLFALIWWLIHQDFKNNPL